jgi:hypothetical protein
MNLTANLNDFNRRMAESLASTFPPGVKPMQSEDGGLLFRGPTATTNDPKHIGTHVAVSLQKDVVAALDAASPAELKEMTENLLNSLGAQVQAQYNPTAIGQYAIDVVGTMEIARG